jgi:hypothetical protein
MNKLEGQLINIKLREMDEILLDTNKRISHLRKLVIELKNYANKSL